MVESPYPSGNGYCFDSGRMRWNENTGRCFVRAYRTKSGTKNWNYLSAREEYEIDLGTLDEFIAKYKPYYINRHLANGKFYTKVI